MALELMVRYPHYQTGYTAKKDLLLQMRVVRFSVEITAFYVIVTVFFCQINQKHVKHASEVTLF
jgi:hypothetical protein